MTRRWIWIGLIAIFLLCSPVLAVEPFNQTEQVHYNQSYSVAVLPVTSTSEIEWLVLAILGIVCLIGSTIGKNRVLIDVLAILASMFIFLCTIKAFAIDTITSYGTTMIHTATGNEWVVLVNHTIYHYDLWGVVFGILFVVALGNQWRLWLDWQRVEEIEEAEEQEK